MNRARRASVQGGWSLVELAVGLSIAALLGVLLFSLLPLGNRVVDADRQQRELAQAEQALLGHARVHARLPSADADGDGLADSGAAAGWLPVADLGLPSRMRVRYQVQPGLALLPGNSFRPLLPPEYDARTADTVNGLDFCMQLLLNQRSDVPMAGLGMPVAFYLAHSGQAGHGLVEAAGRWNPGAQAMPGRGDAPDVAILAAGPGEFAARLACPDRIARAQGNAQAALAAWSAKRATDFNHQFREFDIRIAELTQDQARTGLAFASLGLAMAIADEAIAITLTAAGWPPEGLAIGIGIAEQVVALASIGYMAYQINLATIDLEGADEGLEEARATERRVALYKARVEALYRNASLHAIQLDDAGLDQ